MSVEEKIQKEMDYMELNNRQFRMGLIKIGPYIELVNHHIKKIREYTNEYETSHSNP